MRMNEPAGLRRENAINLDSHARMIPRKQKQSHSSEMMIPVIINAQPKIVAVTAHRLLSEADV